MRYAFTNCNWCFSSWFTSSLLCLYKFSSSLFLPKLFSVPASIWFYSIFVFDLQSISLLYIYFINRLSSFLWTWPYVLIGYAFTNSNWSFSNWHAYDPTTLSVMPARIDASLIGLTRYYSISPNSLQSPSVQRSFSTFPCFHSLTYCPRPFDSRALLSSTYNRSHFYMNMGQPSHQLCHYNRWFILLDLAYLSITPSSQNALQSPSLQTSFSAFPSFSYPYLLSSTIWF